MDDDEQVTGRAFTIFTDSSTTFEVQSHALLDPKRNFNGHCLLAVDFAAACAPQTRIVDELATPLALRTDDYLLEQDATLTLRRDLPRAPRSNRVMSS